MSGRRGSTWSARWLGHRLREVRERARLSLRDMAAHVQRDASSVSRMEAGIHPARIPDVLAYVDLCRAGDQREGLLTVARDVWQTGWWHQYGEHLTDVLADRIWLESKAQAIRGFAPIMLPDLVQTERYAEAVIRAHCPAASDQQIQGRVDVRLLRQRIVTEGTAYAVVVDESALHRTVGGAPTMRAQLDHLATLTARPEVEIRVLPYAAGAHASPAGPFDVLTMPPPYPRVGLVPTAAGEICVLPPGTNHLTEAYDRLRAAALSTTDSAALIAEQVSRLAPRGA